MTCVHAIITHGKSVCDGHCVRYMNAYEKVTFGQPKNIGKFDMCVKKRARTVIKDLGVHLSTQV